MSGLGWLIMRRGGCLWALPAAVVVEIQAHGDETRIQTTEGVLLADEVLGLKRQLQTSPRGSVFRWAAPVGCSGLGLCEHGPLIVVDPASPPRVLAGALPAAGDKE